MLGEVISLHRAYRNDTTDTLEAVYAFPLAWGAKLLCINVELGGR